jgi:hypothetical protein
LNSHGRDGHRQVVSSNNRMFLKSKYVLNVIVKSGSNAIGCKVPCN